MTSAERDLSFDDATHPAVSRAMYQDSLPLEADWSSGTSSPEVCVDLAFIYWTVLDVGNSDLFRSHGRTVCPRVIPSVPVNTLLKVNAWPGVALDIGARVNAVELKHILSAVAEEGVRLHWAAIRMGERFTVACSGPRSDEVFLLGKRVDESEEGVRFEFGDLCNLAESIYQSCWLTVVGVVDARAIERLSLCFMDEYRYIDRAREEFYELVELAIQMVDGSFWLVWSKSPHVSECLLHAFPWTELVVGP